MSRHTNSVAPKLPKALLDRVQDGAASNSRRNALTRKDRRKAERLQKKSLQTQTQSRTVQSRKPPAVASPLPAANLQPPTIKGAERPLKSILRKSARDEPARSPSPPRTISKGVKGRLAQDDADIAALEKKLGLKGGKKLPAGDDGLDELLEGLDDDLFGGGGPSKRKRSEDTDWLEQKRRRVVSDPDELLDESEEEDELDALDDGGEASEDDDGFLDSGSELDEESLGSFNNEDNGGDAFEGFESDDEQPKTRRVRENPYVAPSTGSATSAATPTPAAKYIPPSLRGTTTSDEESLQRLRRQTQGLLNRLSEANLVSILQSVEQLYQTNPRQYVTTTMIDLLLGLICDRTSLTDTFLILHAGFIAAIYKVVGTDFGAQVIERIVIDFDNYFVKGDGSSKETTNLMSLLAELYNFQVIGSTLVFDYIRSFLGDFSEHSTELLLKIIRNSGSQLRSDDPSALKDIVVLVQKAAANAGQANLSVRTKFMIETINSLKNNRMKTGLAASAVVSEHTIRMKKTLGSLNTRSVKASEPLRVSLADIRDTEKKGKWWLVGASYHDPAKLAHSNDTAVRSKVGRATEVIVANDETTDLMQLAREQGMNTDVRRAIFITIMSASDYKDAHLRLPKLNLTKTQELEIPRVLIKCAGAENQHNPYYTLVAQKLCGERKLRMAFQFGLWDLFKRMGEREDEADSEGEDDEEDSVGTRKIVSLARMFAALISDGSLPITVLKNLSFAYLQPKTNMFVEVLLTCVMINCSNGQGKLSDVVRKAQEVPGMVAGLRYFLEAVVAKAELANGRPERKAVQRGCKTALEDLAAANAVVPVLED